MTDAWRNHYDRWRLASPPEGPLDEDGEPIDQDELDAQAEAAAEARAERAREDAMFDTETTERTGNHDRTHTNQHRPCHRGNVSTEESNH